jgi:hypothetical protein
MLSSDDLIPETRKECISDTTKFGSIECKTKTWFMWAYYPTYRYILLRQKPIAIARCFLDNLNQFSTLHPPKRRIKHKKSRFLRFFAQP